MSKDHRVLVVAPAFNEEGKIGAVVRDVLAVDIVDAILVVDDCSADGTSEEAEAAGALVVRHEQNGGVGAAIRTGIYYAAREGFDVVAVIAGDGQHVADELPRVVTPVKEGLCDLAQGSRFAKGGRVVGSNRFREPMIRAYSAIFSLFTGVRLTDATNGLRAFRPATLDAARIDLNQSWLDRYELEPFILYSATLKGLRISEVPCTVRYPKTERYTHMRPVLDWWRLFRPLLLLKLGLRS